MPQWIIVAAIVVAFLLGGLLVAEYLARRDQARHGMALVENRSVTPDKLSSD